MTLYDVKCLYFKTQVMLKVGVRARGHFMTLFEFRMYLIRVNPGQI